MINKRKGLDNIVGASIVLNESEFVDIGENLVASLIISIKRVVLVPTFGLAIEV